MSLRPIAVRALFGVSLALVAYVLYAHAIAWRRSGEYRATAVVIDFASQDELASRFEVQASPGLRHTFEGGSLRVRGVCEKAGSRIVVRGRETRLVPTRASMRFRVHAPAPIDVMAGVERSDGLERELRFGAASTDTVARAGVGGGVEAELRFVGDPTARGPRVEGDRVLARVSESKLAIGAAAPVHEVALGLEPDLFAATGFLDGMVVRETPALWQGGTLVRPAFSVTCRDASAGAGAGGGVDVDVEIVQIGWQPLLRDTRAFELDDRFTAPIFDTRWRVSRADADAVDTHLVLGRGLELTANAKRLSGITQVLSLVSPRVRAEPLRARLEAELGVLKHSTLYLGVSNSYVGLPFFRLVDVGVFEKDGTLVPFTTGHFGDDGQAAFRTHEKAWSNLSASPPTGSGKLVIELAFDPKSRKAIARINGVVVSDEKVALQPYEDIVFHVGINADGAGAEARVRFDRVALLRER